MPLSDEAVERLAVLLRPGYERWLREQEAAKREAREQEDAA